MFIYLCYFIHKMKNKIINSLSALDLEILFYCNGKNNISEIKRETPLSYKSVFYRIKEFEKAGILSIEDGKPEISPEHKKQIFNKVNFMRAGEESLFKLIGNPEKVGYIKDLLKTIKLQRFLTKQDLKEKLKDRKDIAEIVVLNGLLESAGIIRERYELTRKGSIFLKALEDK